MQSIRLQNYRCFEDTGLIHLRPLTLLIGANSSGKSSFLRFFPALAQTISRETYGAFSFTNDMVDLGSFKHTLFHHAQKPEITVELGYEEASVEVTLEETAEDLPVVKRQRFQQAGQTDVEVTFEAEEPRFEALEALVDEIATPNLSWYLRRTEFLPRIFPGLLPIVPASERSDENERSQEKRRQVEKRLMLIDELLRRLRQELERLAYLGPVREGPQRYYRIRQQSVARIDMNGANLAVFLNALPKKRREAFSKFCQEHIGYGVDVSTSELNLSIQLFEMDHPKRKTNLIDLGYGFSQLLPVLAQLWILAEQGRPIFRREQPPLLAIEQPELHIHPRLQSRLGDLLLGVLNACRTDDKGKQTKADPTFLIETHSEPLINRIGELVELKKLSHDDVTVLLFERDEEREVCSVRQTFFNEKGILQDWPIGFMAG